nr:hypothetical protein DWCPWQHM_DWCPWQHM_CDS_0008 [Microvirus sp.]
MAFRWYKRGRKRYGRKRLKKRILRRARKLMRIGYRM